MAKSAPLNQVLKKLADVAKTSIELDVDRLKTARISLGALISIDVKNERSELALRRVLAEIHRPNVSFMVDHGNILISTIDGMNVRLAQRLSEWLRPFHRHGLVATLDADGQAVESRTSEPQQRRHSLDRTADLEAVSVLEYAHADDVAGRRAAAAEGAPRHACFGGLGRRNCPANSI